MKQLILVRHAKSSWDNPEWTDYSRPLNKRGLRDAPFMAELISKKNIIPDLIYSSPAMRAITTAKIFAEALNYQIDKINQNIGIYDKGSRFINKLIANTSNEVSNLFIFGHNPDITSLSSYYSGEFFDNVPTCGVIAVRFELDNWTDTQSENGELLFFEYPKLYLDKDIKE